MNDHQELIAFVLERAAEEPNHRRIKIYRALAAICGDETEETQLRSLAVALEKADRSCREFEFSFIQKTQA